MKEKQFVDHLAESIAREVDREILERLIEYSEQYRKEESERRISLWERVKQLVLSYL